LISRPLVIVLAFGAAAFQISRGAWIEAVGLLGLGAGLLSLRLLPGRKWLAWAAFSVTALAILAVLVRRLS
jgi:hypothetical protein